MKDKLSYSSAILSAYEYLLENYEEVFVIGQGLWSPWYVGNTMKDLDLKFGKERIIDTPVSESAVTGMAVGASLGKSKPIVVHPRIDFMLYAMDSIVNQAAKWSHMTGGQAHPGVTIRGIINRGGEQGAQHSQSLHSWFAHIPGLRVLMPATVSDARDMLVASVLSSDPVIYIDDRWLYEIEEEVDPITEIDISKFTPQILRQGDDLTIVSCGFSSKLALDCSLILDSFGIAAEVVDIRTLNPFNSEEIVKSVTKTGRLVTIDGSWKNVGFSSEVIASVFEQVPISSILQNPIRFNIAESPAPTSRVLERIYYPKPEEIVQKINEEMNFA